jgi:hypothetical protein
MNKMDEYKNLSTKELYNLFLSESTRFMDVLSGNPFFHRSGEETNQINEIRERLKLLMIELEKRNIS